MRRFLLGAGVLLLVAACRGTSAAPAPAAEPAVPVRLAAVVDTTISQPVFATGTLAGKEEIPLGFKIGGVVARVAVDEGQRVRAGELLAELALPEIAAQVAKAEAAQAQAERDLARAEGLFRDSVIARDRYEAAGTAVEVARADVRIARFNRDYAVIRAPVAGTILRRLAEPGQQIAAGTPVLMLANEARGQVVRVGLPDQDVYRVRQGAPAVVRFEGLYAGEVTGRVRRIAAAATPGTGTWEVEVGLERPVSVAGGGLASGLIGRVTIEGLGPRQAVVVPLGALLEGDGDTAVVYSVEGGTARRHPVRVAFLEGTSAAIAGGLEGVREVVVEGAGYLREGSAVRVGGGPEPAAEGGAR